VLYDKKAKKAAEITAKVTEKSILIIGGREPLLYTICFQDQNQDRDLTDYKTEQE